MEKIDFKSDDILKPIRNADDFMKLLKSVGIEGDLLAGLYFKNDPRQENKGVGVFESQLKAAIENDPASVGLLVNGLKTFYADPDVYNFWRYALLSKHLKFFSDNDIVEIKEEIPNCWSALAEFGGDFESCSAVLNNLNTAISSEEINVENYDAGLLTVTACYLALALNTDEDSTANVEKLLRLVGEWGELDGVQISSDTSYGYGEHAGHCRRMLEEFTDVCIEAPEGIDPEADGYMDTIDWFEVADRITDALC